MIRWKHAAVWVPVLCAGCARQVPPAANVGAAGKQSDAAAAEQKTLTNSQKAELTEADKAIAEYTEVIEQDPENARDAYVTRGEAYRRKGAIIGRGELDKAIADFTAALRLAPDDASVYFKRCLAHFDKDNFPDDYRKGMADYTDAIRRDPELAGSFNTLPAEYPEDGSPIYPFYLRDLARCSHAIRLDPTKAAAYDDRANIYQHLATFDLAIADYCEAFRLDPTNLRRHGLRGFCYFSDGDYENAIADFDAAIRFDPKDFYARYNRGLAHLAQNEHDQAVSDFSEALRLDPQHADAYVNRGGAYAEQSQYDKAFADFSEAIRLDPNNAAAYRGRGRAYYIRGVDYSTAEPDRAKAEYEKAIAECTEAIRLDPKSADAYFTRSRAHKEKGEIDAAISDLTAVIRLYPNESWHFYERGMLFQKTKQFAKAAGDYSEVIRLDSMPEAIARQGDAYVRNRVQSYLNRGQAYAGLKDYAKAIADYEEAIRIEPEFYPYGYNALAWVWATCPEASVRDGKKALEYATRACELDETNPDYYDTLAAAYAEVGDFSGAVKWLRHALESPDFSKDRLEKARSRLKLYAAGKPFQDE